MGPLRSQMRFVSLSDRKSKSVASVLLLTEATMTEVSEPEPRQGTAMETWIGVADERKTHEPFRTSPSCPGRQEADGRPIFERNIGVVLAGRRGGYAVAAPSYFDGSGATKRVRHSPGPGKPRV